MPEIRLDGVTKQFGSFTAVDDLTITFDDNAVTCLLGPSGCGKTTLMRMIAGLETPTRGTIRFGDRDVTRLPPRRRDIGMVFQYPVMYPTLTVLENIALPLKNDRTVSRAERQRRIDEVLDVLGLHHATDRFIDQLDAGSRQMVAVGRAVARHSQIILFDEPTTNVEVNAKLRLIRAFKEITRRLKQTIIYVTHDQTEAMTLADRIALMQTGRIVQCAAPRTLYGDPTSEFGGWFLGNPGMNFLTAQVRDGAVQADILDRPLPAPAGLNAPEVVLGVRPEALRLHAAPAPGTVPAHVLDRVITIGGRYLLKLKAGTAEVKVKAARGAVPAGDAVHLEAPRDALVLFRDGARIPWPENEDPQNEDPQNEDHENKEAASQWTSMSA